jgi:GT2 family glycosyltransferase
LNCSIIIVAYYGDPWLSACLSTLADVTTPGTHLLLVNNKGNTLIEQLDLSHFDAEVVRADVPLGFSAANNLALLRARRLEEAIIFLNQDTLSPEDWLSPCLGCLRQHPDVAAVTPLTRTYDGADWDPYFLECASLSAGLDRALTDATPLDAFYEVPSVPAAALAVRASALREVGPFDPVFGRYYEDYDLCRRLRRAGYRVGVCTGGSVRHYSGSASRSPDAERRRARWITRNRVIHGQREVARGRVRTLLRHGLLTFPRGLARGLLRRPAAKPPGAYLAAHWDLLRLLPRLASERRDAAAWQHYLEDIGWPPPALSKQQGEAAAA